MVFILTGPVHSGKTTYLKEAVGRWIEEGRRIGGFLSEAVYEENVPARYDLIEIQNQNRSPFITRSGRRDWPKSGRYFFIPQALEVARSLIAGAPKLDLCVVDEVGPLELRGEGLWPALEKVIFEPGLKFLLVVRRGILRDFIRMFEEKRRALGRGQTYTFDIILLKRHFGLGDVDQKGNVKCVGLTPIIDRLTQEIFGRRRG